MQHLPWWKSEDGQSKQCRQSVDYQLLNVNGGNGNDSSDAEIIAIK